MKPTRDEIISIIERVKWTAYHQNNYTEAINLLIADEIMKLFEEKEYPEWEGRFVDHGAVIIVRDILKELKEEIMKMTKWNCPQGDRSLIEIFKKRGV